MRRPTPTAAQALRLLSGFTVLSVLAGVLLAGLMLPAVGAAGAATRSSMDVCNELARDFKTLPLPEGSVFVGKDGKTSIATIYEENRTVVPLKRMSEMMKRAILAIEDARFTEHGGIDPKGMARALVHNNTSGNTQGASTLTQQFVKNTLIEAAVARNDKEALKTAREKTAARKLKEACMSVRLEKEMKKDQILEGYLNIVNFGQRNYGVEAAAHYYFQTGSDTLTLPQAALLAGMVQLPEKYNPVTNPQEALKRRNEVLSRMLELKDISQAEYDAANKAALPTKVQPAPSGCITAKEHAFFCDYAYKTLQLDDRFSFLGKTLKDRLDGISQGGYKIITTADLPLQSTAMKVLTKKVRTTDRPQSAAVTVEPGTGKVLSMVQNRYFSNKPTGVSDTEVNYSVDYRYGGSSGFPVGSSFKTYILATWLEQGKRLNDAVNGSSSAIPISSFRACGSRIQGSNVWSVNNAAKGENHTWTVANGTISSVNTVFAEMERQLDMCDIRDVATKMGVHMAAPGHKDCYRDEDWREGTLQLPTTCPSLTLGAMEISPLTMANAYATIANDGVACKASPIDSIVDRYGKTVFKEKADCAKAIAPGAARAITATLKQVITRGTATNINGDVKHPVAGKTGTTDGPTATWFVGYAKQRSTAAMVAGPMVKGRRVGLDGKTMGGQSYGQVYGATVAAPIWSGIMRAALKGLPKEDWGSTPSSMVGAAPKVTDEFKPKNDRKKNQRATAVDMSPQLVPAVDQKPAAAKALPPGHAKKAKKARG